jgi:hypothetical protein
MKNQESLLYNTVVLSPSSCRKEYDFLLPYNTLCPLSFTFSPNYDSRIALTQTAKTVSLNKQSINLVYAVICYFTLESAHHLVLILYEQFYPGNK